MTEGKKIIMGWGTRQGARPADDDWGKTAGSDGSLVYYDPLVSARQEPATCEFISTCLPQEKKQEKDSRHSRDMCNPERGSLILPVEILSQPPSQKQAKILSKPTREERSLSFNHSS